MPEPKLYSGVKRKGRQICLQTLGSFPLVPTFVDKFTHVHNKGNLSTRGIGRQIYLRTALQALNDFKSLNFGLGSFPGLLLP